MEKFRETDLEQRDITTKTKIQKNVCQEIILTLKHVANSFLMKLEKLVFTKKKPKLQIFSIYFFFASFKERNHLPN